MKTTQTPTADPASLRLTGELRAFARYWAPEQLTFVALGHRADVREQGRDHRDAAAALLQLARRVPHDVRDGYLEAAVYTRALCAVALALDLAALAQAARIIQDGGGIAFTLKVSSEFSTQYRLLPVHTLIASALLKGELSSEILELQGQSAQDIRKAVLEGRACLSLDPLFQTYPAGAGWVRALSPVQAYLRARAAKAALPEDAPLLLPADQHELQAVREAFHDLYIAQLRRVILGASPVMLAHLQRHRPDLKPLWSSVPCR